MVTFAKKMQVGGFYYKKDYLVKQVCQFSNLNLEFYKVLPIEVFPPGFLKGFLCFQIGQLFTVYYPTFFCIACLDSSLVQVVM